MRRYDKVILLGMDGLDPQVLGKMMAEGALPAFARMWQTGSAGQLRTQAPAQSPVVWSTLATGTNPGKHGVFDFIQRDPDDYRPYLSITQSRGGGKFARPRQNPAFWNVLTDHDVPVTAIRWPVTFPPESINGRMLAGLGVPDIRGLLGGYTFYTDDPASAPDVSGTSLVKVRAEGGRIESVLRGPRVRGLTKVSDSTLPVTITLAGDGTSATVEAGGQSATLVPGAWSDWFRLKFPAGPLKSVYGMVRFRLGQTSPSFRLYATSVELDPERPYSPVSAPGQYAAELVKAIGPYHTLGLPEDTNAFNERALDADGFCELCDRITDDRMGMLRYELDRFREGAFAFVFDASDRVQHMFWSENTFGPHGRLAEISPHIRDHYARMDAALAEVAETLDDRTALLLCSDHGFTGYTRSLDVNAWLVSEGLMKLTAERASVTEDDAALFKLVDWSATQAYACGFSSIYVNLKGREADGCVGPSEADEVQRRIIDGLTRLVDSETGAKPVREIARSREMFSGPEVDDAPDLVVGCSAGFRIGGETAIGGVAADIVSPNEVQWQGDHIVAAGQVPAVIISTAPLDVSQATVLDVAPTLLALLGMEAASDSDGRVLGDRAAPADT